ncbi:MAG: serine protease [Candidatus Rhabdochlamydia sp.]
MNISKLNIWKPLPFCVADNTISTENQSSENIKKFIADKMVRIICPFESGKNQGTGFYALLKGQLFFLTTAHSIVAKQSTILRAYDQGLVAQIHQEIDLCLLSTFSYKENISPIELLPFAPATCPITIGTKVYILGYPLNITEPIFHTGYISSYIEGSNKFSIDATIVTGHSGSPVAILHNKKIYVIGMIIKQSIANKRDLQELYQDDTTRKVGEVFQANLSTGIGWAIDIRKIEMKIEPLSVGSEYISKNQEAFDKASNLIHPTSENTVETVSLNDLQATSEDFVDTAISNKPPVQVQDVFSGFSGTEHRDTNSERSLLVNIGKAVHKWYLKNPHGSLGYENNEIFFYSSRLQEIVNCYIEIPVSQERNNRKAFNKIKIEKMNTGDQKKFNIEGAKDKKFGTHTLYWKKEDQTYVKKFKCIIYKGTELIANSFSAWEYDSSCQRHNDEDIIKAIASAYITIKDEPILKKTVSKVQEADYEGVWDSVNRCLFPPKSN